MPEKFKLDCPHCGSGQKSGTPLSVGDKVRCARCGKSFHVPAPDACPAVPVAKGVAAPPGSILAAAPTTPQRGPVDPSRLFVVLGAALLYLAGGAALAVWCFELNGSSGEPAHAEPTEPVRPLAPPPSPSEPAPLPPVRLTPGIDPKRQKAVNDAIVKGVWFLKENQRPNGSWNDGTPVAYAALGGLTLLECGVFPSDPVVQKCASCVRQFESIGNDHDNYQRAVAILFLDRLGNYKDEGLIQYLALCLIAGQHPSQGGWTYASPWLDRAMVPQLVKQLADPKVSLAQWRNTALKGEAFPVNTWDNSNTQFAILALWVAQRHRVPIDRSIALAEKHFRGCQLQGSGGGPLPDPQGNNLDLNGSWPYEGDTGRWSNASPWPSMTCAGLLGLAMGHAATKDANEKKQKPLDDPAVKQGLAMLAREIDRAGERRRPDYYFLWSLERVGVLYNLEKIDGKDWYDWGCSVLLPRQGRNGSWENGGYPGSNTVLDTCFVLLFLQRANLAQDLTNKLQLLEKVAK